MKPRTFRKTRIATSLSVVLSASTMMPAFAADEVVADENIEVLKVTGIRGSLIKSMDLKRSSNGVVDAINAEDIGKFPDSNLAESLQRITGVSIDRQNGEGSRVSVRGFGADQNLVMLNGRQMPVTTGSRSFDFANIASEAISAVEVEKTSQAKNSTGGIGATINVLTHRPLSSPGLKASFGVKAVDDTSTDNGSITPELSGIYSNTFADGKFGVAISASYQERESGNQQAQVGTGWRSFPGFADQDPTPGGTGEWGGIPKDDNQINRPSDSDIYSVPQTTVYRFEEQQRARTNGQLVLQYEPIDSLRATLDYTYMQNDIDTQSHDVSAWFNFVPTQESTWSDGPVSSPLVYSEIYPDGGADLSMAAGDFGTRDESNSIGFNLEWDATDNLFLSLDYHSSDAERSPNSKYGSNSNVSTAAFIRTSAATDFTGDVPVLAVGGGNQVRPEDMRVTGSVFGNARNKSEIDQLQINGTYIFEEAGSIDFGIAATDVNNHSQSVNVQRNDWGGVGSAGDLDAEWFPAGSVQDKFDGSQGDFSDYQGSASIDPQDVIFLWDFDSVVARAAELYGSTAIGDCGNGFCPSTDYTTDRFTEEKSQSAYVQYNYEGDIGDMPFDVHVGVRYEQTDVESTSRVLTYDQATWIAETEIALQSTVSDNSAFQTQTGEYDYFLPSFNFNIEVVEDVMLRAAYSETIGRPDYTSIQGGTSVNTLANRGGGSGDTGNPSLLPLESENIDFSAEWYYDNASYVSVGYFRKDVTNFISSNPVNTNLYNIADPSNGVYVQEAIAAGQVTAVDQRQWIYDNYGATDQNVTMNPDNDNIEITGNPGDPDLNFVINTPSNSNGSSVIDGWEFAVQHFFGESGFGLQANYTLVNAGDDFDNSNLGRPDSAMRAADAGQNVLTNISDTANIVAMYEDYGFSARLAWNWRDEFLNSTGNDTGANPTYTEEYSQLDFNIGYDIAAVEGLTVFFEGLNITNENTRTHGRSYTEVLNYTQTGARYSLGARYTF